MSKFLLSLLVGLFVSVPGLAQEFGATGGFHYSTATAKAGGVDEEGEIGYKLGLVARFEMVNQLNFRSGVLYSFRPFDFKSGGTTYSHEFAYIDVPALVELKLNDMAGIFGGVVIGINADDKISGGATAEGLNDIIALLNAGVSLIFNDLYGFDIYAERGLGDVYDGAEDITSFGANFVFWF